MKPVALRLGIVGSEGAKFTPATEELARSTIRALIHKYNARMVVSGKCHLGGIDIWAADEARKLGIEVREFEPEVKQWNPPRGYGYKARNEDIVKHSDVVVCITVDKLPEGYTGMKFERCYHHDRGRTPPSVLKPDHVKSGGCWTMELARRMGKYGELVVIRTPEHSPEFLHGQTHMTNIPQGNTPWPSSPVRPLDQLKPQHKYERVGSLGACRETRDGYHVMEAGDSTCILCWAKVGGTPVRIPVKNTPACAAPDHPRAEEPWSL